MFGNIVELKTWKLLLYLFLFFLVFLVIIPTFFLDDIANILPKIADETNVEENMKTEQETKEEKVHKEENNIWWRVSK